MMSRELKAGVYWVGVLDWDRRMFDEFIPLPDGTTYNAYLIQGSDKTALIDTVDPAFTSVLIERLKHLGITRIDYVVSNHSEQDHSGSLPAVLDHFPTAKVVATPKAKTMLADLLQITEDRFLPVDDGATLALGKKTLRFIHFPWVHWPETMLTYLEEDRLLLPGDLFGAHLAVGDMLTAAEGSMLPAAKRYYAEIMMPFRGIIEKNLSKVASLALDLIGPSHGPMISKPQAILDAYRGWISDSPSNRAVIAYCSMHASTRQMVQRLEAALTERGVGIDIFNLSGVDLGKLAVALVDAATLVLGSPTVIGGAHPLVAHAAYIANLLRPKAKFAGIIGSYGWGGKMVDQLTGLMPNLKLELFEPVLAKGLPKAADLTALDRLADSIAKKHETLRIK